MYICYNKISKMKKAKVVIEFINSKEENKHYKIGDTFKGAAEEIERINSIIPDGLELIEEEVKTERKK